MTVIYPYSSIFSKISSSKEFALTQKYNTHRAKNSNNNIQMK
jgi:hypothetical protein